MVLQWAMDFAVMAGDGFSWTDFVMLILHDVDLATDIAFVVNVKQMHDACLAESADTSKLPCSRTDGLFSIYAASLSFVVIPFVVNLFWVIRLSMEPDEATKEYWRKWAAFPPLVLVGFVLTAASPERLAMMAPKEHQKVAGLCFLMFNLALESIPQICCQIVLITLTGPDTITIVSLDFSAYKTLNNLLVRVMQNCGIV